MADRTMATVSRLIFFAFLFVFFTNQSWGGPQPVNSCAPEAHKQAGALYDQARQAFSQDQGKVSTQGVTKNIEQAVALCPSFENGWIFLSQCYIQCAYHIPQSDKKARIALLKKGQAAGDKALALNPKSVGGLFWKTKNMAGIGDVKGWMVSLPMFPKLLSSMDKVDEMDPHYYYGATDRFWCEVLSKVSFGIAKKLGYDPADVVRDLQQEIALAPGFFENYLYAAKVLWKMNEKDRALGQLDYVLKTDPAVMPNEKGSNISAQKEAEILWKEYTGKSYPKR